METGLVSDYADLYRLTESDLLRLEGFASLSARNLVESIAASRARPLSRVLFALGIRHVGQHAAQVLAREYGDMDTLLRADAASFSAVHGIGKTTADALASYLGEPRNQALIERLREAGVNMVEPIERAEHSTLAGRTFVITGTHMMSRKELTSLIEKHGGRVTGSVSKATDYLVAGDSPGSKLDRARELGVTVVDQDGLLALLDATPSESMEE